MRSSSAAIPSPLESCGCVADFNRATGRLTIYLTSQAPHAHRTLFAIVGGIPENNIRVISPDIGGGFGNKVPIYPGYVCAVVASLTLGRPVKWIETRSENLQSTGFARDYHMTAEIAADQDGKMQALRVKTLADHGAFNAAAQPTKFPAGLFSICTGAYDYPDRVLRGRRGLHKQGSGRHRLPLLIPRNRGSLPDRTSGRCAGAGAEDRSRRASAKELHPNRTDFPMPRHSAGPTTAATTTPQ